MITAGRYAARPHTFECARCHRQTSVTAGTILHGSKLALTVWFWAAYLMATHSNGIAALQLQNQLGIGSYRSAWLLAAKLRKAMVDPERDPLSGLIEVDETALAFRTKNDPVAGGAGRSHDGKLLVVGAVEVGDGNAPGRLRLAEIASYGAESLNRFIGHNIAAASTAKTDGWAGYAAAPVETHDPHVIGSMAAHLVLPWIHQVFSISRAGRAASITGCAPSTCKAISTSSCSASTGAGHATPPSARCSASPCAPSPSPTTCWSGRKLVHKRFLRYPSALNSRPTVVSSTEMRNSSNIQCARSFRRQRTTPWIAGNRSALTSRASACRCLSLSLAGLPVALP